MNRCCGPLSILDTATTLNNPQPPTGTRARRGRRASPPAAPGDQRTVLGPSTPETRARSTTWDSPQEPGQGREAFPTSEPRRSKKKVPVWSTPRQRTRSTTWLSFYSDQGKFRGGGPSSTSGPHDLWKGAYLEHRSNFERTSKNYTDLLQKMGTSGGVVSKNTDRSSAYLDRSKVNCIQVRSLRPMGGLPSGR